MKYTQHNPVPLPAGAASHAVQTTMDSVFDWQYALEKQNRIDENPSDAAAMRARYRDFLEALAPDVAATQPGTVVDMAPGELDRIRESLESLGYLGRDAEGYAVDPARD